MTPATDIVIGVRGTTQFPIEQNLIDCLRTLQEHTHNFRLIIVDDNSDPIAASIVAEHARRFPNSLLLRTHCQNWFTKAYNKGLRLVRTPWAVALNADCVMGPGWLEELYAIADDVGTNRPVGLIGSTWNPDVGERYMSTPNRIAGYVTGHCWLLNMDALQQAAQRRGTPGIYLNEIDPMYAHIRSDIEICQLLNGLGYATLMSFRSHVGHLGGKSWGHRLGDLGVIDRGYLERIDGCGG